MAFTLLTPFYFLKAGALVKFSTVASAFGLIAIFLGIKMATKFIGIRPLTQDRVMGSTCQSLVRLAPCSVLVVK